MLTEGIKTASSKDCPRCGKSFSCKPGDIASCECSQIVLTKEEYRYISSSFNDCVCNTCLKDLKKEYDMKFNFNKPANFTGRKLAMLLGIFLLMAGSSKGQVYAPPAGQPGSSAMYKDSAAFVGWATGCTVTRGYQDISDQSLGMTSVGDNTMGTGKAQANAIVSLGDGGSAVCTFAYPIQNGPGHDFAVFENSFSDDFLELAFVEVSSDGLNFFRFPSHSKTDTVTQTPGGGLTDATKINNLAGKYRAGYGTPFDLQELSGKAGLDVNKVTHVRIIDVVGSVNNTFASRDSYGNKINDPWPTGYPSGGFDLDAVGVIHENKITGIGESGADLQASLFPNPAPAGTNIHIRSNDAISAVEIFDQRGMLVLSGVSSELSTSCLPKGIYLVKIATSNGARTSRLIIF